MKRLFASLLTIGSIANLSAQNAGSVLVNFSELLYFTIPLYILTAVSLGLFLLKLVQPYNRLHRWIYLSIALSLIGGFLLTWQMDTIRDEQMLGERENTEVVSNPATQEREARMKEREALTNSTFWMVSIPNIALLALSLVVDATRRKRGAAEISMRPKRYKD